jgi:hypothetical protein
MLRVVRVVALLAAVAAVAAAPSAAKGPNLARVCGSSGCVSIHGESAVQPLMSWWWTPFARRGAPAPAAYYSIRIHDPAGINWVLLYVPARRAMRIWQSRVPPYNESIGPYWRTIPRSAGRGLEAVVRPVRPFAAPRKWGR